MLGAPSKFRQDMSLLQFSLSSRAPPVSPMCVSYHPVFWDWYRAWAFSSLSWMNLQTPSWSEMCGELIKYSSPLQEYTYLVVSNIQNPHFKFLNIGHFQKSWAVTCIVEVTKLANIQKDSLFIICDACIVNQWQKDLPKRMLYKINHSKREKAACFSAIIHQAWP